MVAIMEDIPKEIKELNRFMDGNGLSLTGMARALNMSTGSLSKLRKGTYGADTDNMAKRVSEYLQLQRERREVLPKAPFVETTVALKVLNGCRTAHVEREIVMLAGPSGIGKSMALRKYHYENKSVIYIVSNAACQMHMTMYRIAQYTGASVRGNTAIIADRIVARLRDTNRLVIIDEADHLSLKAFEMLRFIHDESGIGIVLSGSQEMIDTVTGGGTGEGKYSRVYNRIGLIEWLKPLRKSDTRKIVKEILGNEAKPEIIDKLHEVSQGCARRIVKLLPRAWKVAKATNNGRLTPGIIEETKRQLLMV